MQWVLLYIVTLDMRKTVKTSFFTTSCVISEIGKAVELNIQYWITVADPGFVVGGGLMAFGGGKLPSKCESSPTLNEIGYFFCI